MAALVLDGGDLGLAAFWALAAGPVDLRLGPAAQGRIDAARAVVERAAAGDEPIYGLNTGLGANLGHRLAPAEIAAFQRQIIAGRMAGIGDPLPERTGRAALLARLIGASKGGAGLSRPVIEAMRAVLSAGLAPAIPSAGSIGAGDLLLSAEMAGSLIGLGQMWRGGALVPAAAALAEAGIASPVLGPKDGLGLINTSAVTLAVATEALLRAEATLCAGMAAAALALEGYGANPQIFDPAIHAARPGAGQVWAAGWFRGALSGGSLAAEGRGRAIQDPLSFRLIAPVFGAVKVALDRAMAEAEAELNGAADSPLVLAERDQIVSTPNFHTGALAIALDALRIALAHQAAASAQRILKMMTPALSGLPRFLSPIGGASAGFAPAQKLAAALLAAVERAAAPASLSAAPVAEGVEDLAPNTLAAAAALRRQTGALDQLQALEAVAAAQAVHLRAPAALGPAAAALEAGLRQAGIRPLTEDRPLGPDITAAAMAMAALDLRPLKALAGPISRP